MLHQAILLHRPQERLNRILHDRQLLAHLFVHLADGRLAAAPKDFEDFQLPLGGLQGIRHRLEGIHGRSMGFVVVRFTMADKLS